MANVLRQALFLGWRDFTSFWTLRTWLGAWFLRAIAISSTWALLGVLLGSESLIDYLVIGNALAIGASAVVWAIPALAWDRMDGTYATLMISPAALELIFVGRTLVWFFNGVLTALATLAALSVVFGTSIGKASAVAIIACITLAMASTFAFCLAIGACFSRVMSARNILLSLVNLVLLTFTGAAVPRDYWNSFVHQASSLLPLTHALEGLRMSIAGSAISLDTLVREAGVGCFWLVLGLTGLRLVARNAAQDGDVE